MDSRLIDVAIGLVLVFAISSLMVTAMQELWTSYRGNRGLYMRKAIASLLGDDAQLAGKLLEEPLLKSLAFTEGAKSPNPSYVSSDMFVTALLAHLGQQYANGQRPATPADLLARVDGALNPALQQSLQALLPGAEHDWPLYQQRLGAWFDAVGERSIGWFKRNNQRSLFLFGLVMAAVLNINPILISQALWRDAGLRKSVVAQAEVALKVYEADKAAAAAAAPSPAQASVTGGAAASAAAPAESPALRQVEAQLALISEVLRSQSAQQREAKKAFRDAKPLLAAQAATAEIEQALDQERTAAHQGAREAGHALERTNSAVDALRVALAGFHSRTAPASEPTASGAARRAGLRGVGAEEVDRLAERLAAERAARAAPATVPVSRASACASADPAVQALCQPLDSLASLGRAGLPMGWQAMAWPSSFKLPAGHCPAPPSLAAAVPPGAAASLAQPVVDVDPPLCMGLDTAPGLGNLLMAFAGWLVVAFASTLGAPFWFDTLGKLVKLRGSGPRQDAGEGAAAGSAAPTANRVNAPAPATAPANPPAAPAAPPPSSDAMSAAELGLSELDTEGVQRQLGLPAKAWSGRLDLNTRDAIRRWQQGRGERADGILTARQLAALSAEAGAGDNDGYMG